MLPSALISATIAMTTGIPTSSASAFATSMQNRSGRSLGPECQARAMAFTRFLALFSTSTGTKSRTGLPSNA